MSEGEYESFEINDYDLENEFNPNRPRAKLSKNQQIYGIWADDSDNEVPDEKPSRSRRRGKGRNVDNNGPSGKARPGGANYSEPVSFVSGGIQQSGKKKDAKPDENSADEYDDSQSPKGAVESGNTSSESEEEQQRPSMSSMAGFRTKANPTTKGMADWEQHTKGIGAKLLLQMGYQPGKGLGKDLQGIAQPVQAHMRSGRGAIGAYGPEKRQTVGDGKGIKPKVDEDVKETIEFQEKMNHWRKDVPKNSKKGRYYYKSVQDVIDKGKSKNYLLADRLSNVTVIDMRGPEKRVLSGYHALGQTKAAEENLYEHRQSKKCSNFSLPELMHNLDLIVERCEQEIIEVDKKKRSLNDRETELRQDKDNLIKIVDLEENHLKTLEKALELVSQLTEPLEPLTLDKAAEIFTELQTDFAPEYKEFGLGDLAPGVIAPLFNTEMDGWKPLEEPTKHTDLLKKWRRILGFYQVQHSTNVFDPYATLVWSGVMPNIRAAVAEWNPRNHQPMAALLDAWAPLLPSFTLDNILEQLILPRIQQGVDHWDPLTDTTPIHLWILPWTGLLGHKMDETVYSTIREKLGNALVSWLPQDRSARAMIMPWLGVFSETDMHLFLLKHIVPKLQLCLTELIINPMDQDMEVWHQVSEWNEIIPPTTMAQLLEKFFFPKWIETLVFWLNRSPNLDQVSRWYAGWKSELSKEILQNPGVTENFRRALELMHRSTGLSVDQQPIPTPVQPPALMDLQIAPPQQLEFKELVSQKCSERNILFAPMPGRRESGKQVYRVGKIFCYIDRSVVMISDGSFNNWTPVSLQSLLERAISGNIF
ncbi:septin-interacting protein 1 isoform X2 [Bradysia coprophila]|uniref:septin-interacting protein 1 isoform X2 n=1 Tax=Bradysia coprophila TaxID=38358 RepID=UPI00187DD8BF|nr:septin-interacting protein 1 isoform X2 [Bradysia coprophila]